MGPVSRASSVQTAMRNYTGDEGRSFEFDNQVLISRQRLNEADVASYIDEIMVS
jgi:hypothetical protein